MPTCRECDIELIKSKTWWPSFAKRNNRLCIECGKSRSRKWRAEHPDLNYTPPLTICTACGKEKPHWALGLCKSCYCHQWEQEHQKERAAYNRQWAQAHREKRNEQSRQWRKANPEKRRKNERRHRALKNGATTEPVDEAAIYERDGHMCVYCGATEDLTLDHIVALTNGGPHCEDNLAVACRRCNFSKGAKSLIDWLWFKTLIV